MKALAPAGLGLALGIAAIGVPSGIGLAQTGSTSITVTTESDDVNGDTASFANLQANTGSDGVSLREAIEVTNNDPGSYAIGFSPELAGTTITVGPAGRGPLPSLVGGGVSIDGDIDGDGSPDVTIAGELDDYCSDCSAWGLNVVSSDNVLNALTLQTFPSGVQFTAARRDMPAPLPSHQTFANNVVSGLVMRDIAEPGIFLAPNLGHGECESTACETHNLWTDTRLIGNTIESSTTGIEVFLGASAGDAVDRVTIADNTIRITTPDPFGSGVMLTAGEGAGANENRVSESLIAGNSIIVDARLGGGGGVNLLTGVHGGSANLMADVMIVANDIRFVRSPRAGAVVAGIHFALSDGCNTVGCSGPGTVRPQDNVMRDVQIIGNLIKGPVSGVATDPCCGGSRKNPTGFVTDLRIARNVIKTSIPTNDLNPWGIEIGPGGGLEVSRVEIVGNSVVQRAGRPRSRYAARLTGAAIGVMGGLGMRGGSVHDIVISRNRLDTPLLGIAIVGGGPRDISSAADAIRNRVYGVRLRRNTIVRAPVLAARWNDKVKGITVIGGLGGLPPARGNWQQSRGNSVKCISLRGNIVVGKRNAVAVFADLGEGASRNTATLRGC